MNLTITDSEVTWELSGPSGTLSIVAERTGGGALHAPVREAMHQRVEETLKATFQLRHVSPDGTTLLDSTAQVGAMEVYGDIDKLVGLS
jgi:nitrogen fixation protein FixH